MSNRYQSALFKGDLFKTMKVGYNNREKTSSRVISKVKKIAIKILKETIKIRKMKILRFYTLNLVAKKKNKMRKLKMI